MRFKIFSAMLITTAFVISEEPALAQAPADQPPTTAPAAKANDSLSDIVVTARRREERLVDVPISISALNGKNLAVKGIKRVEDLQLATPGLKLSPSSNRRSNSQYELRGITTAESLITLDAAVGLYVNDVYRARAVGTNQSFFDIANVQVLYGPQGTLFGRNSTGGAILINSNHPTSRFEGSLEAGYGNLNHYEVTGVLNVPLSDTLVFRLAGQRVKTDGYATDVSTGNKLGGTDNYSGRLSIDWKPTSSIDNLLIGSFYTANDGGTVQNLYGYRSTAAPNQYGQVAALPARGFNPLILAALANQQAMGPYRVALDDVGATIPLASGGAIPLLGKTGYLLQGSVFSTNTPYEKPRNRSITNITTIDLSDYLTLKNIVGYNYTALTDAADLDATPLKLVDEYYNTHSNQFSDEVQLQGHNSKLNWVVGGMYFHERGYDHERAVQFIQLYGGADTIGTNISAGIFSQGTYKFTEKLSFTAGGRYTFDKREVNYANEVGGLVGAALVNNGGLGFDLNSVAHCVFPVDLINNGVCGHQAHTSYKQPSYSFTLDYKPSSDTLLYIATRRGYRAGGFNPRLSLAGASEAVLVDQMKPFRPETVMDVEAGFKGTLRFGETTFRPSVAVYKSFYTDIQKSVTDFVLGAGVPTIKNAGSAHVTGLESSLGVTLVKGVDIDTYFSIVDGHYINFPSPDARLPAGSVIASVPFSTAKNTAGATITLTPIDRSNVGQVRLVGSYSYRSSYYGEQSLPALDPEAHMPAQYNINVDLGWDNIGGSSFSANLWVKNLTDRVHYLGVLDIVPSFGLAVASVGEPRTFGFTVKYKFGQ
jgi:iron complex outermembrane receptor protein